MDSNSPTVDHTLHEIKNALAIILSASELILAESPGESQTHADATNIRKSALHARTLVENLRRMSGMA